MISLITLGIVFVLIAVRQVGNINFLEFVKIGVPLTVINAAVYWLFLMIL
jgi:hypothetical protein